MFTEIFEPFPDVESVVTADVHRGERQDAAHRDRAYPSLDVRDMVLRTGMEKGAAYQLRPSRRRRANWLVSWLSETSRRVAPGMVPTHSGRSVHSERSLRADSRRSTPTF